MMKKLIAGMMAVLVAAAMLCGCGAANNDAVPENTPAEENVQADTVGTALLAKFKAAAPKTESTLALAENLVKDEMIPFMGGAMEIEPGLLSGFGNAEITGFQSGASFAPMVGSIPFIGYVFELEDGTDTAAFISNLEANADLRWNICVEAEEMVTGSAGNKVFFVMCPKQFEA